MSKFISVRKDNKEIFLKLDSIIKISFEKAESLAQSERLVKVAFSDGSTGEYTAHRRILNDFYANFEKAE